MTARIHDLGEWMEEHGWRRCLNKPDEIACPEHPEVSE